MPYEPTRGVYRFIDEDLDVPHQTSGHRPKQQLPHRDIAAAERQAEIEARARQRNYQSTNVPPNGLPKVRKQPAQQGDDELYQDDEVYEDEELNTRAPRSAIRYQPLATHLTGMKGLNVKRESPPPPNQKHAIPPRRSAKPQLPPVQQQEQYIEGIDREAEHTRYRRRVKVHWLVFLGVGLLLMIAGWMAFNDLGVWWQNHTDDVSYGMPRTYQIDAVVGHGDSNSNPSHFIAINLRGSIYVIEAPGGNFRKARGYFITTEVGGNPNPPVTVKFQDLTHTGHLDMVVTIGDPPTPLIVFLLNNGSQFIAKQQ